MDFDISVRCRIAHVHLPGKPKINVFNIVTDELLLLQRKAVEYITIRYKATSHFHSRAFLILTSNSAQLKLPVQTRIAIGGYSRKTCGLRKSRSPLITQMARRRAKAKQSLGSKPDKKRKKIRRKQKKIKDNCVTAYMLVKSPEKKRVSMPLKIDRRTVDFKRVLIGNFVTRKIVITNASKLLVPLFLQLREKKVHFIFLMV